MKIVTSKSKKIIVLFTLFHSSKMASTHSIHVSYDTFAFGSQVLTAQVKTVATSILPGGITLPLWKNGISNSSLCWLLYFRANFQNCVKSVFFKSPIELNQKPKIVLKLKSHWFDQFKSLIIRYLSIHMSFIIIQNKNLLLWKVSLPFCLLRSSS